MRVAKVIGAAKSDVVLFRWSDDKLKAKDFPLGKKRGKAYPLTRRYRWQVITFRALGRNFRVLVAYHLLAPEFITTLAEEIAGDSRVLARWEFHGTHAGWHVHTVCGDTDGLSVGVIKPLGTKRIRDKACYHRHMKMLNDGHGMDDAIASAVACNLVRIGHQADILVRSAVPWL